MIINHHKQFIKKQNATQHQCLLTSIPHQQVNVKIQVLRIITKYKASKVFSNKETKLLQELFFLGGVTLEA